MGIVSPPLAVISVEIDTRLNVVLTHPPGATHYDGALAGTGPGRVIAPHGGSMHSVSRSKIARRNSCVRTTLHVTTLESAIHTR